MRLLSLHFTRTCSTGHVITKKIMYLVVPHAPLSGVVVEQLIIVFGIAEVLFAIAAELSVCLCHIESDGL